MFQAFGNTWPALFSTLIRVGLFSILLVYFVTQTDMAITTVWILSAATVFLQAILSFVLIQMTLKKRLLKRAQITT